MTNLTFPTTTDRSETPVTPADHDRPVSVSLPVSFSLEVQAGHAAGHAGGGRRHLLGDRFLIGSDPVCDLRIDRRIAAPLHCLLRRDGDLLEAEALAGMTIQVAGMPVEQAILEDGQTLAVGTVRMTIRSHAMQFGVVRAFDADDEPLEMLDDEPFDASGRTALEIVELLEIEQERLRDFDQRRQAGAAALMDAVRRTKRPGAEAAVALAGPSPEELISRLGHLTASLERQSQLRLDTADDIRQAAHELLAAQRTLLGQADKLLRLTNALADVRRSQAARVA